MIFAVASGVVYSRSALGEKKSVEIRTNMERPRNTTNALATWEIGTPNNADTLHFETHRNIIHVEQIEQSENRNANNTELSEHKPQPFDKSELSEKIESSDKS